MFSMAALSILSGLIIRAAVATIVLAIVAEGTTPAGIAAPATSSTPAIMVESAASPLLVALLNSLGPASLAAGDVGGGLLGRSLFLG